MAYTFKERVLEFKNKYNADFSKLTSVEKQDLTDELVDRFNKVYHGVLLLYKFEAETRSLLEAFKNDIFDNEGYVSKEIKRQIIIYGVMHNTDITDWDDIKIIYWFGFALYNKTGEKEYLSFMLKILYTSLTTLNININKDMHSKFNNFAMEHPKVFFNITGYGKYGVYKTYKTLQKSQLKS